MISYLQVVCREKKKKKKTKTSHLLSVILGEHYLLMFIPLPFCNIKLVLCYIYNNKIYVVHFLPLIIISIYVFSGSNLIFYLKEVISCHGYMSKILMWVLPYNAYTDLLLVYNYVPLVLLDTNCRILLEVLRVGRNTRDHYGQLNH